MNCAKTPWKTGAVVVRVFQGGEWTAENSKFLWNEMNLLPI